MLWQFEGNNIVTIESLREHCQLSGNLRRIYRLYPNFYGVKQAMERWNINLCYMPTNLVRHFFVAKNIQLLGNVINYNTKPLTKYIIV